MKTILLSSCAALVLALSVPATAHEKTKTKTTTVDKDGDADVAVSKTRTTSAVHAREGRDVVESRAEQRRDIEGKHFTLAPAFGYGGGGLGIGVGGRFGYTFETPVYVGGNFIYHAGSEGSRPAYYPSAEVGYDIGVGSVLLRPYGGVGALFRDVRPTTTSTALIYPGFTVHYLIPKSPAFVGGDARVLVPLEGTAALAMTATTGLNF